jgi:hypothetical protein
MRKFQLQINFTNYEIFTFIYQFLNFLNFKLNFHQFNFQF